MENVYDVVDESEYAETVSKKREEDWIVDDDGGYVEDGREIFDDEEGDLGYGGEGHGGKTKTKEKGEKAKKDGTKSANIKNMLLSMPSKKAVDQGKLEDDEDLGDILSAIEAKKKVTTGLKKLGKGAPQQGVQKSGEVTDAERNPFMKKGTGLKKVVKRQVAAVPVSSAQELGGGEIDMSTGPEVVDENVDMSGFDDDVDFGEEMEEEKVEEVKTEAKVEVKESGDTNRGFISAKAEPSNLGEGQWVSSGAGEQVKEEEVKVDSSSLPTISVEGEEVMRMYWLDAHEDPYKHPGTVWLFGKVAVQPKKFVSCCVTVKNIPRRIYLAKRETHSKTGEPVSGMDLYNEFNTKVAKRYKISDFKCRPVEMSYAFEHADIPDHGTYLEVLYGPQFPALPADLTGETFCRVFGTPQTSLEMFLLQQKIKGPGWLDISGAVPVSAQVSWCRLEATISNPSQVKVSACTEDQPPLTIISLKLGTVINAKTQQNEVAMAGVVAHTSYSLSSPPERNFNQHFCIITKPQDEAWPFDWAKQNLDITEVKKASSERELLSLLLMKFQKLDPDIIIGHDVGCFDLEVLTHRMIVSKIPNWSKLGRLRRSNQAELGKKAMEKQATVGRLVADLKISAKELIRCKSYELGALVEKCMKGESDEVRVKLTPDTLRKAYGRSEDLKLAVSVRVF